MRQEDVDSDYLFANSSDSRRLPVGSEPSQRYIGRGGSQVARFSGNGSFQTLIARDTLAFDQREVTIEAGPQLANRGRRRVSHRSVDLGIASGSEPGT